MFRQYSNLLRLVRYTKPYEGRFFRKGQYLKSPVVFYNEREWRYVPDVAIRNERSKSPVQPWFTKEVFLHLKAEKDSFGVSSLHKLNEILRINHPLPFQLAHIRYILVQKESEIRPLLQLLKKSKVYRESDVDILASKILTKPQIFEDF